MPYNLWSNMTTPDPAAKWADNKMEEIGLREPDQPGPITRPIVKPQTPVQTPVQTPTNTVNTTTRPVVNPQSPSSGMDYISSLWTSPQEEAERRKASVNRQRVMAVADALRHIGNIYNTVKGSPSQKFTNPVGDEEKRYLTEKAIRDQNNMKVMSYQQAKERQELLKKQADQSALLKANQLAFQQEKFNRQQDLNELKEKNRAWYQHATIEQKEKYMDIQGKLAAGRITLMEAQTALANVKTAAGGFAPRRSGTGGKGGSTGGKYSLTLPNGEVVNYPNKTMWEKDVDKYYPDETMVKSSKSSDGFGERTTEKRKTHTQRAAEGEKRTAHERAVRQQNKTQNKTAAKKGTSTRSGNRSNKSGFFK